MHKNACTRINAHNQANQVIITILAITQDMSIGMTWVVNCVEKSKLKKFQRATRPFN